MNFFKPSKYSHLFLTHTFFCRVSLLKKVLKKDVYPAIDGMLSDVYIFSNAFSTILI